jgi:2-aminoadipate transaminase
VAEDAPAPLPVIQCDAEPSVIDLSWGHPLPAALPVDAWAEAVAGAATRYGWRALTYGHANGPGPLVAWLCGRLGETDARAPQPAQLLVTAGASLGVELVSSLLVRPGDAVVVDSPTYHLALRILADRDADLVPAPHDADGIDPEATAALLRELRRAGRRVPLLYLVPTFANPTGASLPAPRRAALVEVARRAGLVLLEDDTYRELSYDEPAPASLWSLAGGDDTVVRVGSFSKTVAPGLRLGWLTGSARLVRTLADRGLLDSGGGLNHATALAMAEFAAGGGYARHVEAVRARYRSQRDRLVGALRRETPQAGFAVPAGGWFVWLRLPAGLTARDLRRYARAHAVSYMDGTSCHVDGAGAPYIRLSFSMYRPELLEEGARRLGRALARARAGGDR